MKKLLLFLVSTGLLNLYVNAQESRPHCFTSEYFNEAVKTDPQLLKDRETLENFTKQYIHQQSLQRSQQSLPYIIPVVFHILHNYGPENVSDDVIREAVRLMNIDYRKLRADTGTVYSAFQSLNADCEIEFRLATIDPNGNCTTGIEHLPTLKTYYADNSSKTDPAWTVWPRSKYLNIWVANTLANPTAAAYANYPTNGQLLTDGVMCWYTYVDNFTSTLTHEAGHCLNLWHIWGDTNTPGITCGDDSVSDTPITKGWDHCPTPNTSKVCDANTVENYQNYMDYSYCNNMFTVGQKSRMFAALNSPVGNRNNLWTPSNLIATGTDGSAAPLCSPVADFKADVSASCSNDSIHYTDQSWKGTPSNWNWSFPGGSPSTSNLQSPNVLYSSPGTYDATLIVSNATGADTIVKTSIVRITANALDTIPFAESFEDTTSFPGVDGWIESVGGGATWQRATNAGSMGTCSIRMNNYTNTAGAVDSWITPSMNFSNVNSPAIMTFKVANAQRSSTSNDELKVFYSLNCGKSWSATPYAKSGATLSTAGIVSTNFTPSNAGQWRLETVNVNGAKLKPNVRFKFQNTSDRGNNIYIDEINITGNITGIKEAEELQSDFSVYPNPSQGSSTIEFTLNKSCNVIIEVKDILGRTVANVFHDNLMAGIHERKLPALIPGIYLVDLNINNKHHIRKLVVS
jgi:PKD repeat protein